MIHLIGSTTTCVTDSLLRLKPKQDKRAYTIRTYVQEIKSAIDDIERSLAEVEGRGVGGEQAARVTDKLRNELTRLKEDYRERCDR